MTTAAVIVNWNQASLALAAASSVLREVDEVIIVDNGSEDRDRAVLKRGGDAFGYLVIENGRNLGFSGGTNVGLRVALARRHSSLLLLNSDATACPGAVEVLRDVLTRHPEAAAVMPMVLDAASGLVHHTRCELGRWTGLGRWSDRDRAPEDVEQSLRETDYVSGEAFLVRATALEEIGLFDPRFFCYFEDGEWSLRARRHGWRLLSVPQAVCTHIGGASGVGVTSTFYRARNHLLFLVVAVERARTAAAVVSALAMVRPCLALLRRRDLPRLEALLRGWLAGVKLIRVMR